MSQQKHDKEETPSYERQNVLFDALGSHRGRYALQICLQSEGKVSISDLASQVAAWEYDKPLSAVTQTERKRVYTSLSQHHLPKLERAGLLEIDDKSIDATEKARNLDLHIELIADSDISWSIYYLGISVISSGLVLLKSVGVLPEQVSYPALIGGILLVFICSSLIQHRTSKQVQFGHSDRSLELDDGE
ncbi:DUF7344 domain-containing protein [Halostagnicola kamekurae]|uniref:DUF7344 domain-containing protein n=1 Tax=Halostagnicola kamekurae TaxID=619731 RepID=A0A1I6U9P3_9EURY|nr:hypothetical protein [Halostagnicola kamekurae]SFS98186.1 hypothetical protein SAMN04488556_3666 [Halostagnicola kamekurae]